MTAAAVRDTAAGVRVPSSGSGGRGHVETVHHENAAGIEVRGLPQTGIVFPLVGKGSRVRQVCNRERPVCGVRVGCVSVSWVVALVNRDACGLQVTFV